MPEAVTGTGMTQEVAAPTPSSQDAAQPKPPSALSRFFSIENRYLAPMLITTILLVGQISYGLLESFNRTALAIAAAMLLELALGRLFYGKFPHLASSYISGISVGILIRSPEFWPYALCSAISITSKYVIRWKGRHLWNPSNFAICAMLLLAREAVSHHGHLRALFLGLRGAARSDHGPRLPGRGRADHRADVSALHLLYDHRSEDDGEAEVGAMPGGVSGGGDGDGPAIGREHSRAVLRADNCRPGCARV